MKNPYSPREAKIISKKQETTGTYLFTLKFSAQGGSPPKADAPRKHASGEKDGSVLNFNPGQFVLAGVPGFGESALDVCSPPGQDAFELCIRNVGINTSQLTSLNRGDSIFVRGPFGNGFPSEKLGKDNILMIGGGTGIIVIRGLIQHFLNQQPTTNNQQPNIQIFYGARDWNSLLFRDEFKKWEKIADLHLILEKPPEKPACPRGLITKLFEITKIVKNPTIVMAGPPIMYKFCLQEIQKRLNVPDKDIYLSLERRMHCGVGVCQHCAIGEKYVCKDGPVFTYEELRGIKGAL